MGFLHPDFPDRLYRAADAAAADRRRHRMAHPKLNVTLTGTDNQLLALRCPVVGEIELSEVAPTGTVTVAVFREMGDGGMMGPPMSVRNPSFIYGHTDSATIAKKRRDAFHSAHPTT